MTAEPIERTVQRISRATAACRYKVWGFGESIAMEGLLAAGDAGRAHAETLLTTWAARPQVLRRDPLAHVAPGVPLLMLHEARHDARLWNRAIELAAAIEALPHGVASARLHRPDLAGWEHEVWVDCMHLDGPFLARLGWLSADASWHALAVEALLSHARVLQDEVSGLFSHGFDDAVQRPNAVHWGRGQGWALLGLVDTIHWLPDKQDGRREMLERLAALVEALVATETASGEWPTVVDNPSTRFEVSVSAFVTLGLLRAMHFGLIDAAYRPVADRAWASVVAHLAANGDLQGVSGATPVGAAAAHYDAQPIGVFPWGQGAALLAAVERAGESPG